MLSKEDRDIPDSDLAGPGDLDTQILHRIDNIGYGSLLQIFI